MFTSVHSSRGDGARAAVKDEGDERGLEVFTSVHSSRGDGARAAVKDEGDERGVACSHVKHLGASEVLDVLAVDAMCP